MSELYKIGEVAERTSLSIKTIRHYDEVGLVEPSERSAGGFRLYTEADVDRLFAIRRMKPLGFTLDEMRSLLQSLAVLGDSDAADDAVAEALYYVATCRTRAVEACESLRRQLDYAMELTDQLAESATGVDRWATRSAGE